MKKLKYDVNEKAKSDELKSKHPNFVKNGSFEIVTFDHPKSLLYHTSFFSHLNALNLLFVCLAQSTDLLDVDDYCVLLNRLRSLDFMFKDMIGYDDDSVLSYRYEE